MYHFYYVYKQLLYVHLVCIRFRNALLVSNKDVKVMYSCFDHQVLDGLAIPQRVSVRCAKGLLVRWNE